MHIKINNSFIDNADDLDIVKPVYNILKYSDNSITSGILWNYYRDEMNGYANENNDDDYGVNNEKKTTSKSFEYKTKIKEAHQLIMSHKTQTLKSLNNFLRSLDLPLINCKIVLDANVK